MTATPTLILDVMGAELGTPEVIHGAALACAALAGQAYKLVLVAQDPGECERLLKPELTRAGLAPDVPVEYLEAADSLPQVIKSPVEAYKKYPRSSVRVAMDKARVTPASAVISPATTGLVMTAALFTLGRLPGIERPPIGTPLPTHGKLLFFVDGGSNVDCRATHLYQFAVLAHIYMKSLQGVDHPSIALLSNGQEDYKGNALVREAAALIEKDTDLNFAGYVEGHTLFRGDLDIMVCDGFIGNILLKFAEGAAEMIVTTLKREIKGNLLAALAARWFQRGALKRFAQRLDYTVFGGAPLLGVNGNVMICHGRSPAAAIKNALLAAHRLAGADIAKQVAQYVEAHPALIASKNGDHKQP